METNGFAPKPFNFNIFTKGRCVCVVDGETDAVERWVQSVAQKADAEVDWHYKGGRANVLHFGDDASRERVLSAINDLTGELKGTIIGIYSLPRKCVAEELWD